MWDSLIYTINLFFAIAIESSSYEYDMNSMVFLLCFLFFNQEFNFFLGKENIMNDYLKINVLLRKNIWILFYCLLFIF